MSLSNHKPQVMHYLSVDTFRWSTWREIYPTPTYPHPPLPLPTPTHPYPYLPLPQPTPTPTYHHLPLPYPPLPPPTLTTPYHHPPYYHLPPPTPTTPLPPPTPTTPLAPPTPTTNNGLERSQVIGNIQMWSRSRRWIQTPPPLLLHTPTTTHPYYK